MADFEKPSSASDTGGEKGVDLPIELPQDVQLEIARRFYRLAEEIGDMIYVDVRDALAKGTLDGRKIADFAEEARLRVFYTAANTLNLNEKAIDDALNPAS